MSEDDESDEENEDGYDDEDDEGAFDEEDEDKDDRTSTGGILKEEKMVLSKSCYTLLINFLCINIYINFSVC